ncbi:MAG: PfkB family carbohydrate kinase [Anaerolineales bacterium]
MNGLSENDVIDYLVLGHIAQDITPHGYQLGGTAAYASLLAQRMGLRVGLVTVSGDDVSLSVLDGVLIQKYTASQTTTFENRYTPAGRVQTLHHRAPSITYQHIPPPWRSAPIVHLAPVAREIDQEMIEKFPLSFLGISLQGWLRQWNKKGKVTPSPLGFSLQRCPPTTAVVLSDEDVGDDQDQILRYARQCPLLIATKGDQGSDIHYQGKVTRIPTTPQTERDPTGAGDIFASAFFIHYARHGALTDAAHYATWLAARSVTHPGLDGVPSKADIQSLEEVL